MSTQRNNYRVNIYRNYGIDILLGGKYRWSINSISGSRITGLWGSAWSEKSAIKKADKKAEKYFRNRDRYNNSRRIMEIEG